MRREGGVLRVTAKRFASIRIEGRRRVVLVRTAVVADSRPSHAGFFSASGSVRQALIPANSAGLPRGQRGLIRLRWVSHLGHSSTQQYKVIRFA